ncbi:MAG: hypothetical protein A2445_01815 [Candidatus Jacksonbacteria bacterium RIFOXYC2_FULL_44_29]|nr:MAG: hypothetical protein UW45_C0006G0013 [Parcubacteria group bacterium GW2011_GWC2_44_22]OGY75594.1 MAG: hypothetical protein A2295_05240 [Candidatus Jacksonbacteria bacterium RIFOXYB2_FULL_44_15]OGY77582.1 MAG: hypothetical protein A2445_01815 [Candidatus Jacksonbacteria bacterium RIFOXYC2_FULL_44_29]OGY81746.1 MAG: hypothetical protein A2550_01085 [Candidatus Jacksonbacteria bacterium RIFOXYD2_FULL_43_21]HBH46363.1 hypothetical protein [Candidatus Jacksonbacteria bacterium]
MDQYLSDSQLKVASWLFEQKPRLRVRLLYVSFFAVGMIILVILFFAGGLALKIQPHQTIIRQTTVDMIRRVDPAMQFLPKDLQVERIQVVVQPKGAVDLVAHVVNQNATWLAYSFDYSFTADGESLPTKRGFIMPGKDNYFVSFKNSPRAPLQVSLAWKNIRWYKVKSQSDKDRLESVQIYPQGWQFVPGDKKSVVDSIVVTMVNDTPYGLWQVDLVALAYNGERLIGAGESKLSNFLFRQSAVTEIGLGFLSEVVEPKIIIVPQVNVLDDRSIMYL